MKIINDTNDRCCGALNSRHRDLLLKRRCPLKDPRCFFVDQVRSGVGSQVSGKIPALRQGHAIRLNKIRVDSHNPHFRHVVARESFSQRRYAPVASTGKVTGNGNPDHTGDRLQFSFHRLKLAAENGARNRNNNNLVRIESRVPGLNVVELLENDKTADNKEG